MIEGGLYRVYIHLNPVRAGLAGQPAEYTLSGHRELMGKIRSPMCDADESLLAFGPTVKTARRAYVGVLKQAMMEDGLGDEVDRLPTGLGKPAAGFPQFHTLDDGEVHSSRIIA